MSPQYDRVDPWGGVHVDDYAGGAPPATALQPPNTRLSEGQWDEEVEIPDEQFCASISSKTNCQCRAYKVKGELHCHFHLKKVLEERERASHGAEPGTDP